MNWVRSARLLTYRLKMKIMHFLLFFIIVLTIYGLINYYIFIRGLQAIPHASALRIYYPIIFWFAVLSFILGRIMEGFWFSKISQILIWVGSFWLGAMVYFLLIVLLLDFLRLLNHWFPLFPTFITSNYVRTKQVAALVAIGVVAITVFVGYINALNPRIRTLNLTIPKKANGLRTVNLAVVSDIHLGTIVGSSRFNRIVDRINQLHPDIVILPGDIVDEDLGPVIKQNLGETLKNIKSVFGVVAITGNHEYIGGVEKACKYLADHNVLMLRDSILKVNNSFYLVGREDRSIKGFTGKQRKPLEKLMAQVDKSYPIILLDHQPLNLSQAVVSGADLQISGHTHHGQIWPLTYITDLIYEVSCGYKKKGNTQIYVSSGAGTWGPPIRIGTIPEIVNIKLSFQ
ncbi:MAG: metallophosphoesterase [candidate division Zixibacteria bacterium]|nr:metallophosphoesterase [candidate division Zixibacteria bacterium]